MPGLVHRRGAGTFWVRYMGPTACGGLKPSGPAASRPRRTELDAVITEFCVPVQVPLDGPWDHLTSSFNVQVRHGAGLRSTGVWQPDAYLENFPERALPASGPCTRIGSALTLESLGWISHPGTAFCRCVECWKGVRRRTYEM